MPKAFSFLTSWFDSTVSGVKIQNTGLNLVGVERFELPTHCSQSSCATRLRYTPISAGKRLCALRQGAESYAQAPESSMELILFTPLIRR